MTGRRITVGAAILMVLGSCSTDNAGVDRTTTTDTAEISTVAPTGPTVEPYQGPPNELADGTCPKGGCSLLGARLRGFAPAMTYSVGCDYYPARVKATTDDHGDADVLTRCFAGNTEVSLVVDGYDPWGPFTVEYAR